MLPIPVKIPGFHSERSPSTAHRWRLCRASVQAERGLPDTAGEEAIQGTVFHEVAADCLEVGIDPHHFVGTLIEAEPGEIRPVTQEMADKMLAGLDVVWGLTSFPGAKLYVEKRVNLERWIGPDESGTSDAFIIDVFNWRLVTFDWKWGGLPVLPEWNDQAMCYTLGVWDTYAEDSFRDAYEAQPGPKPSWEEARDSIEVMIIIEQPRAPGGGGVWREKLGTIFAEGKKIRKAADETLQPNPEFNPGEKQCKFCKAARFNTCEARKEFIGELLDLDFDDMETDLAVGVPSHIREARAFTPEERTQILKSEKMITELLEQLKNEAMKDSEHGLPVPGMKRVAGRRPPRKWRNQGMAEVLLMCDFGDEAHTKKLKSPAAIQDTVGKKAYEERYARQVEIGSAKAILVPEDHPGEALQSIDDAFDDMMEDDLI